MSDTQEKLEHILDRLAVRMYDEGQLDKPSLLGRQVAVVNIREAQEAISDLIESAKREGAIEALEKLESLLHIHMDDKTSPGEEWPKQDMAVVIGFIEALVAELKQSEESE